ncbi:MAG: 4Fe-4S dicluster domain-containing protein [Desulfobacteraceae bacterium]
MLFQISLYLALAVCAGGLALKMANWFQYRLDFEQAHAPARRTTAFVKGCLATMFSKRLLTMVKVVVLDVLLQVRIYRISRVRWIMHLSVMYGFLALLLLHALEGYISDHLFADYYSTRGPFLLIRNLAFSMVMLGVSLAVFRRSVKSVPRLMTSRADQFMLITLAIVMLSGMLLEGSKILSFSSYQEMVADYAALDDPEDETALASYWAANFGIVHPDLKAPFDAAALTAGAELHDSYCAACHSRPQWAFASYGFSRLMKPIARILDQAAVPTILWHVHYLACFFGLAMLPFSKFLHIFSTPLSLMANAVMDDEISDRANIETRQIMEADACTHCGACTQHCAVGIIYEVTANASILPSEKIALTRLLTSGQHMNEAQIRALQSGLYLCTNCHRCTDVCPAGINLQQLWFKTREYIFRKGFPDTALLSPLSYYRGLMARHISKNAYERPLECVKKQIASTFAHSGQSHDPNPKQMDAGLRSALKSSARSANFSACFTCSTCTSVCPVVKSFADPQAALDLMPHQIMHAAAIGLRDMVFGSRMLWTCLDCYQCQEACPQGVHIADLFCELRVLARNFLNQPPMAA